MNINKQYYQEKTTLLLNFFFIIYAGTFIIDSSLSRLLLYVSTILWFFSGNIKEKIFDILKQKIFYIYFGIIFLFFISLYCFSFSVSNGWWALKYETGYDYLINKVIQYSVMMILIYTVQKKEYVIYLIIAFVLQTIYTTLYTNGIMLGILDTNRGNIFPFFNHIYVSVALNISIFSIIYLFFKTEYKFLKWIIIVATLYMIVNLFIFSGRTGQISFIIITLMIIFYVYKKHNFLKKIAYLLISSFIFVVIIALSYNLSKTFKSRVDNGISNISGILEKNDYNTSLGVRIVFDILNTNLLLDNQNNFIFGYGMGDAKKKFENYLKKNHPDKLYLIKYEHVHNQYYQTWIDGGILAFILLLILFFTLLKLKMKFHEKIFLISIIFIFILYNFSGILFGRAKMIEMFTLYISIFLLFNRFYLEKYRHLH